MGGKQLVGFIHGVAVLNPVDQQCIPLYFGIQGRAAADTQRLLAVVGGQVLRRITLSRDAILRPLTIS